MQAQSFINSASQFIQLLKEKDDALNILGLKKLLPLVDTHWHEISEHLQTIEEFYENERFSERKLAAYIASKIYFNLEEHQEALELAIKSGDLFNLNENSQFTDQLINTCIEIYIQKKQHNYEQSEQDQLPISPDYEKIVEFMFEQSINQGKFQHAIGIAVEARRMDVIEVVLKKDQEQNTLNNDLLQYLFEIAMTIIQNRQFRIQTLKKISEFYKAKKQMTPQDLLNQSLCCFYYDDHESVATILNNLITSDSEDDVLAAYQIANEISENENQYFINKVIQAFPIENDNEQTTKYRNNLITILTGETRKKLNKIFLTVKNFSDPHVINQTKDVVNQKQSISLGGVTMSHGILNSGTNDQTFLDNNKEWLKGLTHWNKFSTVASLGVIHKGSNSSGKQIFADYIPGAQGDQNQGKNPNANGGSLYGMGLLYEGSKNQETLEYFQQIINHPEHQQNETIIHGAALGLGLVGLASEDQDIYMKLQNILNTNQSISGEAAGIGMGLVLAGSGNEMMIEEILNFAKETDRDKIVRSCSLALAMIVFGKEQAADTLIETLTIEKNALLRYGACMAIGMAYVGSGNDKAIKKLLNFAVTDVADDVRRQAVISLAFVMFRQPEEYLKMVKLLSISYSPHVRYGTALGIGICCAGTCSQEAYDLLEPLLTDTTSFVKQAAYIGTAMLFQLANKNSEPKLEKFTKTIEESYAKRSEDPIVKYGSMLAQSILRSGGQNSVIKLASSSGFPRLGACVSMLVFTHFWHWFPLVHFFNLTLQPSAIIGVNKDFKVPKGFQFNSNCKPSYTDYIPHVQKDDKNKNVKKETVSLSTTNRAKARAALKEGMKDGDTSKVDNSSLKKIQSKIKSISKKENLEKEEKLKEQEKMELEEQKKKEEITSAQLQNPSRVLDRYKKHIQFIEGSRYTPIIKERKIGILFLKDNQPDDEEEYVGEDVFNNDKNNNKDNKKDNQIIEEDSDIEPPEDFIFDPQEQAK